MQNYGLEHGAPAVRLDIQPHTNIWTGRSYLDLVIETVPVTGVGDVWIGLGYAGKGFAPAPQVQAAAQRIANDRGLPVQILRSDGMPISIVAPGAPERTG